MGGLVYFILVGWLWVYVLCCTVWCVALRWSQGRTEAGEDGDDDLDGDARQDEDTCTCLLMMGED